MLWGYFIPSLQAVAGISMEKGDCKSPRLIGRTFFTTDCKSVGTPSGVGRLAEDSLMHHPLKTKYSLARNKCISRGHQIRPRDRIGRFSFHRMRMKMPRLGGSYVAAEAFSKKTVRDIIGRLEIACDK